MVGLGAVNVVDAVPLVMVAWVTVVVAALSIDGQDEAGQEESSTPYSSHGGRLKRRRGHSTEVWSERGCAEAQKVSEVQTGFINTAPTKRSLSRAHSSLQIGGPPVSSLEWSERTDCNNLYSSACVSTL